ncbi:hybrid sensor histidine kinase/response regulator [Luteolibacter luteus]|uniref:histidine kinase n=1 Tax=Luteolibacter luteus TaxID=2728835 RepID=A0A858RQG2_9BACT|nr:ATP-binding protein [Luteolibacter luteus]QJE98163.1 response regulator [Luteolibacter luteus]
MTGVTDSSSDIKINRPAFWVALIPGVLLIAFFAYMRLVVFHDRVFPLSSSLPLLLCLWSRSLRLLYGMAVLLSIITLLKVYVVLPEGTYTREYELVTLVSQMTNIWVVVLVLHGLLVARAKLERRNADLALANAELENSNSELAASNEELAAREEEISQQNEELQSQAEELEQQSEELRQQTEEMEQQGAELMGLNQELGRRERGLETLLNSGRWMLNDVSEAFVMSGVCQAGIQILSDEAEAADVASCADDRYEVWGDAGFGLQGRKEEEIPFEQSFAALVMESGRTASIEDMRLRPDIMLPVPRLGRSFLSAMASPIWHDGKIVATLCFYSSLPRQWSEHDFSIAEWLASQASFALQSLRFQRELEDKRLEAEDAARQKSRFLAAISHDVRTPANAISLLAELIQRSSADPKMAPEVPKLAKNLWDNARLLVDLVSDVLDLTRLDSGHAELNVSDFGLVDLLRGEVSQGQTLANRKGVPITGEFPEEEIQLATDRTKLSRIVANLLGNAVKFTESGEIHVSCKPVKGGAQIQIADTGCGIPEEALKQVFDEFFQLRNPERDREKGTGLGLAICRRLAASLDATISVDSKVGDGSTFTIFVPDKARRESTPAVMPEVATEPVAVDFSSVLHGLRVLLIEDNEVARIAVGELITREGAIVSSAATGREGLRLLEEGGYDALLLDLNLPDMDGSEILQRLQIDRPADLRRIVVITGDARYERVEQSKALGADLLLAKPLSLARLCDGLK